MPALERLLMDVKPEVGRILNRSLEGHDPSVDDAVVLLGVSGLEANALVLTADELRRRRVGDVVTYVVNRNVNFTNVCIKRCGFCAFSRDFRQEEGYFLPVSEIIRRAREAWDLGATEVCVQAGLPPQMDGDLYIKLCEAMKAELPDMHIHGFSPRRCCTARCGPGAASGTTWWACRTRVWAASPGPRRRYWTRRSGTASLRAA